MPKILVIADDFTGAAEIGGIAHQFGLSVLFSSHYDGDLQYSEDVLVIDTDTRNCSGEVAFNVVGEKLSKIDLSQFSLIFKKTDSILRGSIESEISSILKIVRYNSCLLIPSNPSKTRTISDGQYLINGIPIHKTEFANDPHYPRKNSNVLSMISDHNRILHTNDLTLLQRDNYILLPDVISLYAIEQIVKNPIIENCLIAGGADFFRAILALKFKLAENKMFSTSTIYAKRHFIIGSRSDSSKNTIRLLKKMGYVHFPLSRKVMINKKDRDSWIDSLIASISRDDVVIISRPEKKINDYNLFFNITEALALAGKRIMELPWSDFEICIEGGATARAILLKTTVDQLKIKNVLADGIVRFGTGTPNKNLIVKPGSYTWPDSILKKMTA